MNDWDKYLEEWIIEELIDRYLKEGEKGKK
jgi:hypothetical protein